MSVRRRAAAAGTLPAEALNQRERDALITHLHHLGWSDTDIAEHTRLSTYTTGRILDRLCLSHIGGSAMTTREHTCQHCETQRQRIDQAVTLLSQQGTSTAREAVVLAVLTGEIPAAGQVRP